MTTSDIQAAHPGRLPRLLHRFCVPVLLGWLALTAVVNIVAPQLEIVGEQNSVSLTPDDAPSLQATKMMGKLFQESDSNSSAMIVLESEQPLGDQAHQYYDGLIQALKADSNHVQHVQDLWGDPLTAAGSQSADNKATYVQIYLAGNQGEALANESVRAVRDIVASNPTPPGLKAYVTGGAPLASDQQHAGDKGVQLTTALTIAVVLAMLLLVYRSAATVCIVLLTVMTEVAVARGVVAVLGNYGAIGLSTFAVNLLTMLGIAAGTDYAIFLIGRYHEARLAGETREAAYYSAFRGTVHVILGSGLTIAGATFCLSFTRLPYFKTLGAPLAVGIAVLTLAAVTMAPALLTVASRFGLLDPKRQSNTRRWRRVGTAVVRWPGPILAASVAITLIGLLALPSYKTSYNDRKYMPSTMAANAGYEAAERHFPSARLNPEVLLVEADHDLRNSADMLIVERIAKGVFHLPGIARVQTITRPLGTPLEHSSIPYQIGMQGVTDQLNQSYSRDRTAADLLAQAGDISHTIDILRQQLALQQQSASAQHEQTVTFNTTMAMVTDLRDKIANFDDFLRPIRSYFYWEPHCFDIPVCAALRSVFDSIDGISQLTDQFSSIKTSLETLDALQPQLVALLPPQIASQEANLERIMANYATQHGLQEQQAAQQNSNAMGRAFDEAKIDDSFYLPPEVFDNPDFKRGLDQFVSPDGKAVRFIISHQGDPASPEGIAHIDQIKNATFEAIKGTPMETSKVYLGGTAATYKDMQEGSTYDLVIAAVAALCLIFVIMLLITRAVIAALVIVGTVVISLAASFGLSVLIWQHVVGLELHWMILGMSVIILLAVGSDYNLLLVSRFKEERQAGLKTGIIRSMAGSGSVVTAAGLVFAFTMMSMAVSDLRVMGQVGTTIGLGLLFDTLVVRSFMTPSIAALTGRWFWWPNMVATRPARRPRALTATTPTARHSSPDTSSATDTSP